MALIIFYSTPASATLVPDILGLCPLSMKLLAMRNVMLYSSKTLRIVFYQELRKCFVQNLVLSNKGRKSKYSPTHALVFCKLEHNVMYYTAVIYIFYTQTTVAVHCLFRNIVMYARRVMSLHDDCMHSSLSAGIILADQEAQ